MNPRVGKRAGQYVPPAEKPKTKSRLFIESRKQHNMSMKEDYLRMQDVEKAINMNALEQRLVTKLKILKMLESKLPKEKLAEKLEEEIHLDWHRLKKYYRFEEGS
jgi:hypothetical protein